jgi:tetratricopeptide (TPR) repeat protein
MRNQFLFGTLVGIFALLVACSTERNTFISRSYHGATAHYNGYFNANDLLNEALNSYRSGLKEDYYKTLTIAPLPNEEEVKNYYTPIDTAIAKCTKVIQRHAMPSMDKPSQKKSEFNNWIDENWLTIGVASYYRRDYDAALKNFSYINRFFVGDKTKLLAEMWMARTFIQQGNYTEAGFALDHLDKAMEEAEGGKDKDSKTKKKKSKFSKKSKKEEEGEKEPEFPKSLKFDLPFTKALLAEKRGNNEDEIKYLEEALLAAKKKHPRARIHYILGQLYEQKGDRGNAAMHYSKSLKYNPPYEMAFNARLKNALNSGGEKTKQDLNRMLRDTKNAEFKDQIYYTLALIAQNEGDEPKTIENFTKSALYSMSNKRQQGMSYEKLGDIFFVKKDYYKAQKYYDSCARVIPETYPNYEGVKNKASKLESLVIAIETAQREDSLQRIAGMSESEQYAFAEKVIAQLKQEDKIKKEQDAARLALMQEQQALAASKNNNSKSYWGNDKARQAGLEEFKKLWGNRDNEDDWRRSDKIVMAVFDEDGTDSIPKTDVKSDLTALDSLTPEMLLADVPNSDSTLEASREKLASALFDAGKIYQEQLNETGLAEAQYQAILDKPWQTDFKLSAAYQIYRMYGSGHPTAERQKDFILINYPTSDYAGYLRDPEYFIKKRERAKQTELDYLKDLDRYERGLYYPVITSANNIIDNDKENPFLAKYYLLKAFAQAKLNEDKKTLLPTLDELIAKFPNTDEAKKAKEMKDIIEKGYSTNTIVDLSKKKGIYEYTDKEKLVMVIFLTDKVNNNVAKTRVVDFTREFFGKDGLNTSSKILKDESVIIVKDFKDEAHARDYYNTYKRTRKHLLDMQNFKILYLTESNFKTLFETQKLAEYEVFFDEYY